MPESRSPLKAGSGVSRFLTLVLPVVVAGACVWMARPQAAAERGATVSNDRTAVQSVRADHPVSYSDATLVSLPAASQKLITRPIEDIRPGMRVLASNPEETETLADADVTAEDWRLVSLTMTKEEGGTLHVQLLRPIERLITEVVILIAEADDPQSLFVNVPSIPAAPNTEDYKLQRLLLGQTIHLDLPELGAQGPATVTAIDPCPPLDNPQPGRRIVTGTFRHSAGNVVDLQVGSEAESFGVTDNHPFWSVDRGEFVEAGLLQIGEQLQCADGTITQVTRITPRRGPPVEVYNFEVDAEHVYHVGNTGVLVHNACVYAEKVKGVITYIGRTNRIFSKRASEWRRLGRDMEELVGNITPKQARALEHVLIEHFGRVNNLTGTLQNLIGGIQLRKLQNFTEELEWARNFLANM